MKYYNNPISFSFNLRSARIKAGYAQSTLAEMLGMTRQNYSRYESDGLNAQPSLELLCELSCILKTTPNDLIGYYPIENFSGNEIEYARNMLDGFNNITEKDNEIIYDYLDGNKAEGFMLNTGIKLSILMPKKQFIDFVRKSRFEAEKHLNERIGELFKRDFINRLNSNCFQFFKFMNNKN